jgi:hypothetical protein
MSHWHVRKRKRVYRPGTGARHFAPQTKAAEVGQAARPTLAQPDLEDARRAEFIRALDSADFELGEWEAEFTGSMFQRIDKKLPLTDKMRVQIDRLLSKYGHRVPWSGRPDLKPVRSTTREAYVPDPLFNKR